MRLLYKLDRQCEVSQAVRESGDQAGRKEQDRDGREQTSLPVWVLGLDGRRCDTSELAADYCRHLAAQIESARALDAAHATVSKSSGRLTCLCAIRLINEA